MKTLTLLLIALPLWAQPDLPSSTLAATQQYEAAVAKAKAEYEAKEKAARQTYIVKLQEAALAEGRKGNLDGAGAIKGRIEELAEKKSGIGRLQIVKASCGVDKNMVDCTENVQALVDDDSLSIKADCTILKIADPAWGQVKTLSIEYSFDGRKRKIEVRDGQMVEIGKSFQKK